MKNKTYDKRHGGPYDRGTADSWYLRSQDPHYYIYDKSKNTKTLVSKSDMTPEEIEEYMAGYEEFERLNLHEDYS